MDKELCLIHANCQGDPLAELLQSHEEFSDRYKVRTFTNYTREVVPGRALSGCSLFLYQWLGLGWGGLSSASMLEALPAGTRTVCIPNLFFKAYWPLWDSNKIINYSDMLLNDLIERGLSKAEILHIYLQTDIKKYYNLESLIQKSIEKERQKEKRWDFPMVDAVLQDYREEPLFKTVNHPGRRLCLEVADNVLGLLGFDPLDESARSRFQEPFPEFEQPIHPQVVDYLGLSFVDPETRYFVYGGYKTFEEYANCYVDCRLLGINDFIGYLRLDCGRREEPWQPDE